MTRYSMFILPVVLVIASGLLTACRPSADDAMTGGSEQPKHVIGFYEHALAMTEVPTIDRAIEEFNGGTRLISGMSWPASKSELERAVERYTAAIKSAPQTAENYYFRGNAFYGLGECDLAIKDYGEVVRLVPSHADAYYVRANTYRELGFIEKAIEGYSAAIEAVPDYLFAYYLRATAYLELVRTDEAITDLEAFISMTEFPEWAEMARQQIEELSQ